MREKLLEKVVSLENCTTTVGRYVDDEFRFVPWSS